MLKTIRKAVLSSLEVRLAKLSNSFMEPRFINFITTYKCNSRCVTCNIWSRYQENNARLKEELTLSEIEDFFIKNKKYLSKLIGIGFTGGEFTLREDAVRMIEFFKKHFPGAVLGFQTNGLYPERVKEMLKEINKFYPKFNIAVSIDGPSEIHDKIRGVKGAFDKAIQTIRYAQESGASRITSGMTISRLNYSYIPEVYKICKDIGADFSCFMAETSEYFHNQETDCRLDDAQKKAVSESLKRFGYDYFMDNLRLQIEGRRKNSLSCYSGYSSLVIDPYGNIVPCILMNKPFGNIKGDDDLKAVMSKKATKDIRKSLKNCHCWCQCEVSSSAFVDPIDVLRWFVFDCKDKRGFLKKISRRWASA